MRQSTNQAFDRTGVAPKAATPSLEQMRLLDSVLTCIAQGVCVVDRSLTVRLMNPRFIEMFDLPADYARPGRPVADYIEWSVARWTVDRAERRRLVEDVLHSFRTQPEQRFEETWPDGRVIELWRRPLPDGGFVTTYTDVTENADAEQELVEARNQADEANRAKSEFLAIMSHELRTPLNAIIGFSDVMQCGHFGPLGDARYVEYIGDIRNSGLLLLDLINDILDIAKIDAGKLVLYFEPLDAGALLRDDVKRMQPQADAAGVALRVELPADTVTVQADKTRLRQILLNLMSNAIKFTPRGGTVTARLVEVPGAVRFEVADTGVGMTDFEIQKALEPFGQVQSALSRNRGGTGLGLTIVKQLTELHDGSLSIDSVAGRGTCVSVTLPQTDATV